MSKLSAIKDRFGQGLIAYVTANSGWQGLRRAIEQYPEILNRRAELAIQGMIRKNPEQLEIVQILEQRRDFLI